MDRFCVQSSEVLSALSVGEVRSIGQFQSFIPSTRSSIHHAQSRTNGTFQQTAPFPQTVLQDQCEERSTMNGCKVHLINNDIISAAPVHIVGGNVEHGCSYAGTPPSGCDYQRPRSHSMGLVILPDAFLGNRYDSRTSLASCGSLVDGCQSPKKNGSTEEVLVEMTCNRFKRLSTRGSDSPKSLPPASPDRESKNSSRSPPRCDEEVRRKYSIGSQLTAAKRQMSSQDCPTSPHGIPMDLSCKRKKSDASSTSLNCLSNQTEDAIKMSKSGPSDPDFKDSYCGDQSILKSVLIGMGRKRSHTLSVCGRQDFRNNNKETPVGFSLRQRVTLAKRNLGPVMGRMSEHLNKITLFLCSVPEFQKLSSNDQEALISDTVHRLLMLYAAESNLQFVVTPMRDDDSSCPEDGKVDEEPTMQFTETVQNFISKCQAMNISSSEYSYMRMITLFHSGSRTLADLNLVEKANAEAQQNLQSLVQQCYPDDRLRYSKLLLSLYTLFGINCKMLEALFCRHLIPGGSGALQKFVYTEFMNSTGGPEDGC